MTAATLPAIGAPAPDFTLPSTAGAEVTLSALRGRNVLLAFFPLAFTRTCTEELCEMRDDWDRFERANTTVFPTSVDSIPTLSEFKRQHGMKAELLSDFKRVVSRAYGVLNEDKFVARRSYFLIDAAGVLRWSHVEEISGVRRSDAELLEQIARLS